MRNTITVTISKEAHEIARQRAFDERLSIGGFVAKAIKEAAKKPIKKQNNETAQCATAK